MKPSARAILIMWLFGVVLSLSMWIVSDKIRYNKRGYREKNWARYIFNLPAPASQRTSLYLRKTSHRPLRPHHAVGVV